MNRGTADAEQIEADAAQAIADTKQAEADSAQTNANAEQADADAAQAIADTKLAQANAEKHNVSDRIIFLKHEIWQHTNINFSNTQILHIFVTQLSPTSSKLEGFLQST